MGIHIITKIKNVIKKYWKIPFEIIIFLLAFVFYFYFGQMGFKYLSHILFSKEGFDLNLALLSILVVAFFIWIVWGTVKLLLKLFKTTKKLSKNNYFILAITSIIIILIFGISMIRALYLSPFPVSIYVPETEDTFASYLECHSQKKVYYFMISDNLRCNILIRSKESNFMNFTDISKIQIMKYAVLERNMNISQTEFSYFNKTLDSIYVHGIAIPIIDRDPLEFSVDIQLSHKDRIQSITLQSYFLSLKAITYEGYAKKLNERLSLLLILFSLAIFSVLSGIRSLKNIIEDK